MKPLMVPVRTSEEIAEIEDYYESKQAGLGLEFQAQLKRSFLAIRRTPDAFAYDTVSDTRKYVMRRFPYVVHYLHEETWIEVIAVAHQKRKPGYWQ